MSLIPLDEMHIQWDFSRQSSFTPYDETFFVFKLFTNYMRASIWMVNLSQAGDIFVMTHDSIELEEDWPTPQPIDHLANFLAMPNVLMLRPGDGIEIIGAAKPSILALSRQKLPKLAETSVEGVEKDGYIISAPTIQRGINLILS